MGRVTAGSDGGGIAFEQKSSAEGGTNTLSTQYLSLMLLDLSNLASTDYFFTTDNTQTYLTDEFQSFASITPSGLVDDDDWLVFGFQNTLVNLWGLIANAQTRMVWDDASSGSQGKPDHAYEPRIEYEMEDEDEEVFHSWVRAYTIRNSIDTSFTIQCRMEATHPAAEQPKHRNSTLFGLRLSAFENYASSFTSEETPTTDIDWHTLESISFTPDSTGDVLVFGTSLFEQIGSPRQSFQAIELEQGGFSSTIPNSRPASYSSVVDYDDNDILPQFYVAKYSGVKQSSATLDLNTKQANEGGTAHCDQYTLAMMTTKINTPHVFYAVALDTYNSGDVASQTFASGDVANDTYTSGDVASEVNPE